MQYFKLEPYDTDSWYSIKKNSDDGQITKICNSIQKSGARFTKHLTIYQTIILTLSQDRLTLVTYNVPRFLLEYRKIYKHCLRWSRDFTSKSYLRKALRSP